jgi:hypothetical protein
MVNDRTPAHELGIVYPDVEIVRPQESTGRAIREAPAAAPISTAPLSVPLTIPMQVRVVGVEIRDVANNTLVASIEILSPANKREPGFSAYQAKRDELRMAGVHVLEIDLLRRGTRPWPGSADSLPKTPYVAVLMRAGSIHADVWPIGLRERLPILPTPLRSPDPEVPLDVQMALASVYKEARYSLTINYGELPPEPPLPEADVAWMADCVRAWRKG